MIFPYRACSCELCGSFMPCCAKENTRRPEQSIHLVVLPPMQCGVPIRADAVLIIFSKSKLPVFKVLPLPPFKNALNFGFSLCSVLVGVGFRLSCVGFDVLYSSLEQEAIRIRAISMIYTADVYDAFCDDGL